MLHHRRQWNRRWLLTVLLTASLVGTGYTQTPYEVIVARRTTEVACCFSGPVDPRVAALVEATVGGAVEYEIQNRWTATATNPATGPAGTRITLTYGFVPDGTLVPLSGAPWIGSNLFGFLDGLYGSTAAWQGHFAAAFSRWGAVCGIDFVREQADDGSDLSVLPGTLGIRADIRIGGRYIDGESGYNLLAFNYYPNVGDMVLDTGNPVFYGNQSSNARNLRNTVGHEIGHGIGLRHTCPEDQTKLMEPTIALAFDGPQHDDILGAQRNYGDARENNNAAASASDLGALASGTTLLSLLSCSGTADPDVFRFVVNGLRRVTIQVTPQGATYNVGAQPASGPCSAGSTLNSLALNDLSLQLVAGDGVTPLAAATLNAAGAAETLSGVLLLPSPDQYYVRVAPGAVDNVQMYELSLQLSATTPLLTGGYHHCVALRDDGTVWTWGWNLYGQLGDGTTVNRAAPAMILGGMPLPARAVSAGREHSLALGADGTVWSWGRNTYGQLGQGSACQPVLCGNPVPAGATGLSGVTEISAGLEFSAALRNDGTVWCFGSNLYGNLGVSGTAQSPVPVQVSGLSGVSTLARGDGNYSLALKGDGTLWSWGQNFHGALGNGTTLSTPIAAPVQGITDVVQVAKGSGHALAVRIDGSVWSWGWNASGQLGDGSTSNRSVPGVVPGLGNVTAVAAGWSHSLALRNDGTVLSWGSNVYGQLGVGMTCTGTPYCGVPAPTQVPSLSGVVAIAAGIDFSMALLADGTYRVWGNNSAGEFGTGATGSSSVPVTGGWVYVPPTATISSVTPSLLVAGSAPVTLTVLGVHFNSSTRVTWNGQVLSTAYIDPTRVTASVPPSLLAGGQASVAVSNSLTGGAASNALPVTISNPAPVLTSISPSCLPVTGFPGFLTLAGSGFTAQSQVLWNLSSGGIVVQSWTSTALQVEVAASLLTSPSTASVRVLNPMPGGGFSALLPVSIVSIPLIASVSPPSTPGGQSALLTISGTGFLPGSVVRLTMCEPMNLNLQTTFVTPTQLQATVPAGTAGGTYELSVALPCGFSAIGTFFFVDHPPPVISSVSPAQVSAGINSPVDFQVFGSHLGNANPCGLGPLSFWSFSGPDGSTSGWISVYSASPLHVWIPQSLLQTPGLATITVSNLGPGGGSSSASVNVVGPAIASLTPPGLAAPLSASAPPFSAVVHGTNFVPASQVYANATPLATTFVSPVELSCVVSPGVAPMTSPGALAFAVENSPTAPSPAAPFVIGSSQNRGLVVTRPFGIPPGQTFDLRFEGGVPSAPVSAFVDLGAPMPVGPWPDAVANLLLGVSPLAGSGGPFFPLANGMGIGGPGTGEVFDAGGNFVLPGFLMPSPPLGLGVTLQAIYADFTAPFVIRLTWTRRIDL